MSSSSLPSFLARWRYSVLPGKFRRLVPTLLRLRLSFLTACSSFSPLDSLGLALGPQVGLFEQSLKKFAISAYRRIADIERMVERLHTEVREMISDAPKSEITNLRIVDAIVSDTGQLVRSSISAWADVIGEELLAIERIKRLEHEKELLRKDN